MGALALLEGLTLIRAVFLGFTQLLGIDCGDLAAPENRAGFRFLRGFDVNLFDDANTGIAAAIVHALRFEHGKIAIVKDGIDLPFTALVSVHFECFHIRHGVLRRPEFGPNR